MIARTLESIKFWGVDFNGVPALSPHGYQRADDEEAPYRVDLGPDGLAYVPTLAGMICSPE